MINNTKNRNREPFSFANINLLGKCNVNCFFCLGKDIEHELRGQNQLKQHFLEWKNFSKFLDKCNEENISKIYITGQNTDSLLYEYLGELIAHLQNLGFKVGLRTNGFAALEHLPEINACDLHVGYSVHTISPTTSRMILGNQNIPNWSRIFWETKSYRISIVLNRCNEHEFFPLLRYLSGFQPSYIQIRRVSTDTRLQELEPDLVAYERVYTTVSQIFPVKQTLWGDAQER